MPCIATRHDRVDTLPSSLTSALSPHVYVYCPPILYILRCITALVAYSRFLSYIKENFVLFALIDFCTFDLVTDQLCDLFFRQYMISEPISFVVRRSLVVFYHIFHLLSKFLCCFITTHKQKPLRTYFVSQGFHKLVRVLL